MKLTIRNKINGLLIFFSLSIAIMIALFIGSLSMGGNAVKEMETWSTISGKAHLTYISVLEARRNEKDFFARMDIKYASAEGKSVDEAKENLEEIQKLVKGRDGELSTMVENGKGFLNEYNSIFKNVVESYKVKGLTQNEGLQGSFRNKVHDIEDLIRKQNRIDLMAQMLTVRRHEKDYLLRGDEKYVKETVEAIDKLKVMASKSNIGQTSKMELIKLADEYSKGFSEYVAIDKKIEKETDQFRAKVHKLEPVIKNISDIAGKRADEQTKIGDGIREKAIFLLPAIGIIFLALLITLGVLISRSITRPLMKMSGDLEGGADQVSSASVQLSSASQSLSQGASEQASSIEETSASLEEIASMVNRMRTTRTRPTSLLLRQSRRRKKGRTR